MAMSVEPALLLDGLDVTYSDGAHALRGVSLSVEPGERVGIIGPNGAGKTTIARVATCMTRAYRATVRGGHVYWGATDITRWQPHRALRTGIVSIPEGRGVIANMTVEDNLRLVLAGLPRSRRPSVTEAYAMYGVLGERRNAMAGLLSGGEQQMLAVARAMLARPKIIVADEISLGLAPRIVIELLDGLKARAEQDGTAILLIEQAALMSLRFAERAYILDHGAIVASGTSAQLRQKGEMTARYLGIADLERTENFSDHRS